MVGSLSAKVFAILASDARVAKQPFIGSIIGRISRKVKPPQKCCLRQMHPHPGQLCRQAINQTMTISIKDQFHFIYPTLAVIPSSDGGFGPHAVGAPTQKFGRDALKVFQKILVGCLGHRTFNTTKPKGLNAGSQGDRAGLGARNGQHRNVLSARMH